MLVRPIIDAGIKNNIVPKLINKFCLIICFDFLPNPTTKGKFSILSDSKATSAVSNATSDASILIHLDFLSI